MVQTNSPIDIARQTFMQLSKEKKLPTPENYRSVYNELAGIHESDKMQTLGKALQKVLHEAGRRDNRYSTAERALTELLEKPEASKLEAQLHTLLSTNKASNETNWSLVIRNLLKQLETSHKGVTLTRKKDGLSRVLTNFGSDSTLLGEKIQALVDSWGKEAIAIEVQTNPNEAEKPHMTHESVALEVESTEPMWRSMMLETLELELIPNLKDLPEVQKEAKALFTKLQQPANVQALGNYAKELKSTLIALEMQRDTQQQINDALLNLLRLLTQSMDELVIEDDWLHSQITIISEIVSKPININTLYDAESSLKDLIQKQMNLKPALHSAKDTLKMMVATFIHSLAGMTTSTSDYHSKIEGYQKKLSSTDKIDDLNSVLKTILEDTREVNLAVERSRTELEENQKKAQEAEQKIKKLTAELDHISEVAHEDFLTGTLNRRGMDEALEREFVRADRFNSALSIAMMDIDHFKKINDTMGHAKGDLALTHFAKVVKKVKRATDVLARYGGEEFIIILPATNEEDAVKVIQRVQRELTKNFFMNNEERVLITFSAGVAERLPNESVDSIVPRVDAALYEAKNTGRNRVVGATTVI